MDQPTKFHASRNRRQLLALLIAAVWLLITLLTLWWFKYQYVGDFQERWVDFDMTLLLKHPEKPQQGYAKIVHYLDPSCPCTRFAYAHIKDIEQQLELDAEFQTVTPESAPRVRKVPASPAVAIWDRDGALAYFGPYSSGFLCGQGEDLVMTVAESLQRGDNPEWINQQAVGCFCEWPVN